MVRVIKSGSLKSFVCKCQYCGCEFSYNEKDITYATDKTKTMDGKRNFTSIKCPECYNDIILL